MAEKLATGARWVALAVVGFSWSLCRSPADDEVERICATSVWFRDGPPGFVLATQGRVAAYMESCRAVWPTIEPEVKAHLGGLLKAGELNWVLQNRWRSQILWTPKVDPEKCGGQLRQKTKAELKHVEKAAHAYLNAGVHPLHEPTIELAEIAEAFKQAEVARFDGRKLVPQYMFNVTMENISKLHPESKNEIPVYMNGGYLDFPVCHEWLQYLGTQVPGWGVDSWKAALVRRIVIPMLLRFWCPKVAPTLDEVADWAKDFDREGIPFSTVYSHTPLANSLSAKLVHESRTVSFGQANLRRFPNFLGSLKVAEAIGIDSLVQRTHNFLWIGTSNGQFHDDFQDNVVVQLSGKSTFIIFPANCTSLVKPVIGPKRVIPAWQGHLEWATQGVPKGKYRAPFYHVTLHPGDGLAIPSTSVHKVVTGDSFRLSMNAFFEPRFGKMRWLWAPMNSYNCHHEAGLAMRHLWMRALTRMYDTTGMSIAMHTERLEFL